MGRIDRRVLAAPVRVSAVIPSRDGSRSGNVPRLVAALEGQTRPPDEVVLAVGYAPCGRAHNAGARAASGEVLVFLDDDVLPGSPRLIERLLRTLECEPGAGIAGAAQLLPPDSGAFARSLARGSARAEFPVQSAYVDTDLATHACLALRRETYWKAGGEPDDTLRADDQALRARVRALGLRVGVAPGAWVHHPLAAGWRAYLRGRFLDGRGAAHDARARPDLIFDVPGAGSTDVPRVTPRPLRAVRWMRHLFACSPVPAGQAAFALGYAREGLSPTRLPAPTAEERSG